MLVWLYVPEILPEKGVGLATASNWFFTTFFGKTSEEIVEAYSGRNFVE